MATLISSYDNYGCTGRCDAKCYNAKEPGCQCICGGANHGSGLKQAMANTQEMAEKWIEAWKQDNPTTTHFEVPAAQLPLL